MLAYPPWLAVGSPRCCARPWALPSAAPAADVSGALEPRSSSARGGQLAVRTVTRARPSSRFDCADLQAFNLSSTLPGRGPELELEAHRGSSETSSRPCVGCFSDLVSRRVLLLGWRSSAVTACMLGGVALCCSGSVGLAGASLGRQDNVGS